MAITCKGKCRERHLTPQEKFKVATKVPTIVIESAVVKFVVEPILEEIDTEISALVEDIITPKKRQESKKKVVVESKTIEIEKDDWL